MSKIIICIGNVASGKTTWSKELCSMNLQFIRINADQMRGIVAGDESNQDCNGTVFSALERMAEYLLKEGKYLVIDNLNYNRKNRKTWISLAKKYDCFLEAKLFMTPYVECVNRNNSRERKVPIHVLERVADGFEPPTTEEGFDSIEYVTTT